MHVRLSCPHCSCQFVVGPDSPALEGLSQVAEDGPWSALGDGATFEDSLSAALDATGGVSCPRCDEAVPVSEESLGEMTMALLAQW